MKKTGVYILKCANGRFYVGSTDDIERRLQEHHRGKSKATKYLLPVELVKFIESSSLIEARQLELSIKKQKSRKYIASLITAT